MTVSQLIEVLQQFDGDTEVMTAAPSHDYWGTVNANKIGTIDTEKVTYSHYHDTYKVVNDDKIDNYDNDDIKEVILLSM